MRGRPNIRMLVPAFLSQEQVEWQVDPSEVGDAWRDLAGHILSFED